MPPERGRTGDARFPQREPPTAALRCTLPWQGCRTSHWKQKVIYHCCSHSGARTPLFWGGVRTDCAGTHHETRPKLSASLWQHRPFRATQPAQSSLKQAEASLLWFRSTMAFAFSTRQLKLAPPRKQRWWPRLPRRLQQMQLHVLYQWCVKLFRGSIWCFCVDPHCAFAESRRRLPKTCSANKTGVAIAWLLAGKNRRMPFCV